MHLLIIVTVDHDIPTTTANRKEYVEDSNICLMEICGPRVWLIPLAMQEKGGNAVNIYCDPCVHKKSSPEELLLTQGVNHSLLGTGFPDVQM
jgi:hypothetical protein